MTKPTKPFKCFTYYEVKLVTPDGYFVGGLVNEKKSEINKWVRKYTSNVDYRGYFVKTAHVVQERIA